MDMAWIIMQAVPNNTLEYNQIIKKMIKKETNKTIETPNY